MKIVIRWRPLTLVGLALLGLVLRLYGLNWDLGNGFHPDERQIIFRVSSLAWPTSFAQFLDPVHSPLNPQFFAYGSFPLYLLALVAGLLGRFFPGMSDFSNLALVGRVLSVVFDSGTILLTGWSGLLLAGDKEPGRHRAWNLALLAAAFVTFTPFQIQLAHFYIVDTLLVFFVMLTLLACVALVDTERPLHWALLAGLGYGLALATKFSAAPLIVALLVAFALRWSRRNSFSGFRALLLSLLTTGLIFLIVMPYALIDRANFLQQVKDQGDLARGMLDLPYVRQFAGTVPFVYEIQNLVLWGLGLTLGITVLGGLVWCVWRVLKRRFDAWMIILTWILVYGLIIGTFYVKFMRYMLPLYPPLILLGTAALLALVARIHAFQTPDRTPWLGWLLEIARPLLVGLVLAGTIFQGLALLNVYSQPNTRIQASRWIYAHLPPGSTITYEQWDDPLPIAIDGKDPAIYPQASYLDAEGHQQTGLDLYGDDTVEKAHTLATMLSTVDAIMMPTDRLDKSIPRLPARYPLTIHYYQLLFSGQLGFHLAAQFEVRPNLLGITLDDSNADESYSVFDHPHARIFVRDTPYSADVLYQKLLAGVQLPAPGAGLSGNQRSLVLTPQQLADDQQSPPFSAQFPQGSLANTLPVLCWWLALLGLGWLLYPLAFYAFRVFADRGYLLSKTLGVLLLAFLAWWLAALHWLPFSPGSLWLCVGGLLLVALLLAGWQRQRLWSFLKQHWRLLVVEEVLFSLAFLLFVGLRALNPDLWNIYWGGEKPMELGFLNAILRSPYLPPYDPWFAGGYINYYYYGYVLIASLIKLTGIAPMVAFNLAIPTLFALTLGGIFALVYSLTRRAWVALLASYLAVMIGNLDGLVQLRGQLAALIAGQAVPAYSYWQSSRIIPFTINEFPFWSFLFADLHPHVIDLPLEALLLGIVGALLLAARPKLEPSELPSRGEKLALYGLAALALGSIACVNPWDMPVYTLILGATLLIHSLWQLRGRPWREQLVAQGFQVLLLGVLWGVGYLLYWPFYASYQQLYVNGVGLVPVGTGLGYFLTVFGVWIFLALSFFLVELYRRWQAWRTQQGTITGSETRRIVGYLCLWAVILIFASLLGVKALLTVMLGLGIFLFVVWQRQALRTGGRTAEGVATGYLLYGLPLLGLAICLGMELVYVRDFLDGGDYERMNTVFKFSLPAWLCFAIGGALIVQRLWCVLRGLPRHIWLTLCVVMLLSGSIFLSEGVVSRINDHQSWVAIQRPAGNAAYTPTLDGYAFLQAWYPADAGGIAWLNAHVAGSPVVLEAAAPVSYQWFGRISVYTGLPDIIGWPDHVGEQRYASQPVNRLTDVATIYTTMSIAQALALLHNYHVRYIYVGPLERETYGGASLSGLAKFDDMVGTALRVDYRSAGVTIYEIVGS